jgi:hypothetical protein
LSFRKLNATGFSWALSSSYLIKTFVCVVSIFQVPVSTIGSGSLLQLAADNVSNARAITDKNLVIFIIN